MLAHALADALAHPLVLLHCILHQVDPSCHVDCLRSWWHPFPRGHCFLLSSLSSRVSLWNGSVAVVLPYPALKPVIPYRNVSVMSEVSTPWAVCCISAAIQECCDSQWAVVDTTWVRSTDSTAISIVHQSHQMSVYMERLGFCVKCDPGPTSTASSSFPLVTGERDIVAWYSKWLQHIAVICSCFGQAYQPRLECLKTCPEGEGTQCTELTEHRAMAATAWQLWAASLPCCCVLWDWDLSWVCCILLSLLSLQLPGQCSLSAGWDCASLNFGPQVELFRCPRPWRELSRRVKVRSLAGGLSVGNGWDRLGRF